MLRLSAGTAFVPVPLHRERLVERGFNQAALVASSLAASSGGRFVPRALVRSRKTDQQARLGRDEREANVREAFAARPGLVPSHAVLVDDVVTTGATALACVQALRQAGSEVIAIAALARADSSG